MQGRRVKTPSLLIKMLSWKFTSLRFFCVQNNLYAARKTYYINQHWFGGMLLNQSTNSVSAPILLEEVVHTWFSYFFQRMVEGMVYYSVALAADDIGGSNRYANYILTSLVDFPAVLFGIYSCRRYSFSFETSIKIVLQYCWNWFTISLSFTLIAHKINQNVNAPEFSKCLAATRGVCRTTVVKGSRGVAPQLWSNVLFQ